MQSGKSSMASRATTLIREEVPAASPAKKLVWSKTANEGTREKDGELKL